MRQHSDEEWSLAHIFSSKLNARNEIMYKAYVMIMQALRKQMNRYYWIHKASALTIGCDRKQQSTKQSVKRVTTQ